MSDADPIDVFLDAMWWARLQAGHPTSRSVAEKASASHTTVASLFSGQVIPSWAKTSAILIALGVEQPNEYLDRWRDAWAAHKKRQSQGNVMAARRDARIGSAAPGAASPKPAVPAVSSVLEELAEIRGMLKRVLDLLEQKEPRA